MILDPDKKKKVKDEGDGTTTASVTSLFYGAKDQVTLARDLVSPIRDQWPLIAQLLGGLPATNEREEVLGGTITIYIRDGQVKFVANVKSAFTTINGSVKDLKQPFDSIECALLTGEVSSKRYTERESSLPSVPGDVKLF